MKVKVKTLTGPPVDYDVELTDTILSLKEKVAAQNGVDVGVVRLAFSGRMLNNGDTLEASRVKEGDTLIAVIPRQKPAAKPAPAPAPAPEPAPTQPPAQPAAEPAQPPAEPAQPPVEPLPATEPSSAPIPGPESAQPAQPRAPAQPQTLEVDQAEVAKLVAMGFPQDECVRALRLAFNNSDRAVQFLLEGFPEEGAGDVEEPEDPGFGIDTSLIFQRLTADPQFQQLRTVIQANPTLLPQLLNQIKQSNPEIYAIIMQNREEFSRWLSETSGSAPIPTGTAGAGTGAGAEAGAGGAGAGATGAFPAPQPARPAGPRIELSDADRAALQSLVEMGFDQGSALQAYMACDKNVEMAANLLFENGGSF